MKSVQELLKGLLCMSMTVVSLPAVPAQAGETVVTKPSHYSVPDTIDRIDKAVTAK